MTKLLDKAFEKARALPEAEQDALAAILLDEMPGNGDRKWEGLFADPRSEKILEKLWAEAQEEIARGEVYDLTCNEPHR